MPETANVIPMKKRGRPKKEESITASESMKLAPVNPTPVKERGRGGVNNFGNNYKATIKTEEDRKLVSKLLFEALDAFKQTRVTSDEELVQRLSTYFDHCATTGQIPTVEEMALYTGYSVNTVWDWENGKNKGFSPNTSAIIKKAKNFLQIFDAKMVLTNKINVTAYIFRGKNYYGMVDEQKHVMTAGDALPAERREEDLRALYGDSGKVEQ